MIIIIIFLFLITLIIYNFTFQSSNEINLQVVGRSSWNLLHAIANKYPDFPSQKDEVNMIYFFNLFMYFFPCKICSKHMLQFCAKYPIQTKSKAQLSNWFCQLHNSVNIKLNKSIFDCEKLNQNQCNSCKLN